MQHRISKHIAILFFLFLTTVDKPYAQTRYIDSLKNVIISAADTDKVSALNGLAWELKKSNTDTAILLCNQALAVLKVTANARPIWKQIATARTWSNIGWLYHVKGDTSLSFKFSLNALALWNTIEKDLRQKKDSTFLRKVLIKKCHTIGNLALFHSERGEYKRTLYYDSLALNISLAQNSKIEIARYLGNIGIVYSRQSNYHAALKYYLRALQIDESILNKTGMALHYGNIGILYNDQGNQQKALEYFNKALELNNELGDKNGIASNLTSMAMIYSDLGQKSRAKESLLQARNEYQQTDNVTGVSFTHLNIGYIYFEERNYEKAKEEFMAGLRLVESQGRELGIADAMYNLALLYATAPYLTPPPGETKKGLTLAMQWLEKSLKIRKNVRNLLGCRKAEYLHYQIDSAQGRFKEAYNHYKLYRAYADSISGEENIKKQTQLEMQYEFDKKESEAKSAQAKKDAVEAEEKRRQEIVLWCVIGGLALVLAFAVFILRAFRQKQKANTEILKQKHIIEEKQKEILDSIYYARRIQRALITGEKNIEKMLATLKKQ